LDIYLHSPHIPQREISDGRANFANLPAKQSLHYDDALRAPAEPKPLFALTDDFVLPVAEFFADDADDLAAALPASLLFFELLLLLELLLLELLR
jgi:hypothetical protein